MQSSNINSKFIIKYFSQDNITISPNSTLTYDITKSGYTGIGCVGYNLSNATTNGQYVSFMTVFEFYVNTTGTKAYISIRNDTTYTARISCIVFILFSKS